MADIIHNKLEGVSPTGTWRQLSANDLLPVRSCFDQGRHRDAYDLAHQLGPLQSWSGGEARTFAAELAGGLGGHRLRNWLYITMFRDSPGSELAQMGYVQYLRSRQGPLAAWQFLDRQPIQAVHSSHYRYCHLSNRAAIALHFRDFDLAERLDGAAIEFCERPELTLMAQCRRLRAQDRLDQALEKAREAVGLMPTCGTALHAVAEILQLRNHDEECEVFLDEIVTKVQDPYLVSLKVRLAMEQERFEEVLGDLDLFEKYSPLIEKPAVRWLNSRRSDVCYHLARFDESVNWAEKAGGNFHLAFAARLRREDQKRRVRLPVGFIRQDHNTCAPATLTALAKYFGAKAEHASVAENICYDGTYDFQERQWAESNGFFVREFQVTWEASSRLIEAGVPFALNTQEADSAHLQAVVGYDLIWQTLLIRDPGRRDLVEFGWQQTEIRYRAVGPRGLAFVPLLRKSELELIELPGSEAYDALYRISLLLNHHRREEAAPVCVELERMIPGERLAIVARRLIADYDGNVPAQMACAQELLELFPGDARHSLTLLACLRQIGRREQRLALLEGLIRAPDCNPLFWKAWAVELADDARALDEAQRYLRRTHRALPWHTATVAKIADTYWQRGELAPAADFYRFAACADDKREGLARSYFQIARLMRRNDEAVAFLRRRLQAYGSKSPLPVQTLFYALEQLEKIPEAFAELQAAVAMRPLDGSLLCYAAGIYARFGRREEAARCLRDAESECPRTQWLRVSARLKAETGDLQPALELWREVADLEPMAKDAHEEIAALMAKVKSRAAALGYLQQVAVRFPFNIEINRLLLGWLAKENRLEAVTLCRRLVADHPADAWLARELASQMSHFPALLDEAFQQALRARDLEPRSTHLFNILGLILRKQGRLEEARVVFREAIHLDVDNSFAIRQLIDLDSSQEAKRKDLHLIHSELVGQVVFGAGLREFRIQARRALPAAEVLGCLEEARKAKPELWEAWSGLTLQLADLGRLAEALATAQEASRRFPFHAEAWRNLGSVLGLQFKWVEAAAAWTQARLIAPGSVSDATQLSEALQRQGQVTTARTLLETAICQDPTSPHLHGYLADLMIIQGDKEAACRHLSRAIELDPDYDWAWTRLREHGNPSQCVELARSLAAARPGEAVRWRALANNLNRDTDLEEQLQAVDHAIALEPQNDQNYNLKAKRLAIHKRFHEALSAAQPTAWKGHQPVILRGRVAWIEHERGNRRRAIELMRQIVADDSTYAWGWESLLDWLMVDRQVVAAEEAASQLVLLNPGSAYTWGCRAEARLKQGNRAGALADLQHALVLDPTYNFGIWTLFDLHLDDENHVAARTVLDSARLGAAPAKVLVAELRLDLCQGFLSAALERLALLAPLADVSGGAMDKIVRDFAERGELKTLDRALDSLVGTGKAAGPCLQLWVVRKTARRQWNVGPVIGKYLAADPAAARFAVDGYLRSAGNQAKFDAFAHHLLQHHRAWLTESDYTWGIMGYALNQSGCHEWCAAWMHDWRDRLRTQRWMLANLAQSLRHVGRLSESEPVNRRILEIESGNALAHLDLAFDAACAGESKVAAEYLKMVDRGRLGDHHNFYARLTDSLIHCRDRDKNPGFSLGQTGARLAKEWRALAKPSRELLLAYRLCLVRMGTICGEKGALLRRLGFKIRFCAPSRWLARLGFYLRRPQLLPLMFWFRFSGPVRPMTRNDKP